MCKYKNCSGNDYCAPKPTLGDPDTAGCDQGCQQQRAANQGYLQYANLYDGGTPLNTGQGGPGNKGNGGSTPTTPNPKPVPNPPQKDPNKAGQCKAGLLTFANTTRKVAWAGNYLGWVVTAYGATLTAEEVPAGLVSDGTGMLPGGMTTVAGLTFSSYMGHADTLGTFLQGAAGGGWDNFHQAMTSETISFAGTAFGTTPIGALLFSGVVNSAGMIGGPPQDVHCL